jgi:hypothetical protein
MKTEYLKYFLLLFWLILLIWAGIILYRTALLLQLPGLIYLLTAVGGFLVYVGKPSRSKRGLVFLLGIGLVLTAILILIFTI